MGDKTNQQGPSNAEASLTPKERRLWNSDFNKFVKHLFQKGYSREDAWNKCSELDEVELLDNLSELIQHMDTNPFRDWLSLYFKDFPTGCMCQFVVTMEMYERAKNEIDTFLQDDKCNYRLLNERYTLCFAYDDPGKCIYLIDNFHGQHKKFKIDGESSFNFENSYCFWSEIISSEYLLFVEEDPDEENLLMSLIGLDLQKSKATLLQTKEICAIATNFIFDFNDRKKFAYLSFVDFLVYAVHVGRVENDQIIMNTEVFHISCELFCPRLDGEKLQGLIIKEDQSGIMEADDSEYETLELKFGEFHLKQTEDQHLQFHKLFDVDIPDDMHIIHLPRKCHYISPTLGYSVGKWTTTHHAILGIFLIDMEAHALRFLKSLYYHNAEVLDIHIDELGTATLCIHDKHSIPNEIVIQKIALREPQTLFHQSLFAVHRSSKLYSPHAYGKFLQFLPPIYKPMAILQPPIILIDKNKPSTSAASNNIDERQDEKRQKIE